MQETAYAKINLALHVRARDPDGYHRIETIFAFCEDGDVLFAEDAADLRLTITGPFAYALSSGEDNLVMRAASMLKDHFRVARGVALRLDKRLPIASGIGGGSADAAAAIHLLCRWWELPLHDGAVMDIATSLGADVPACLHSETAFGEGRGDLLSPIDDRELLGLPILLVNPGVEVPTGAAYAAWDGMDCGPILRGSLVEAALAGRNDLEKAAIGIAPVIGDVLRELAGLQDVILARMSGSGATCFALFKSEVSRDTARQIVAERHPQWWQFATHIR